MLELIKRRFGRTATAEELLAKLIAHPAHTWIRNQPIMLRAIKLIYNSFDRPSRHFFTYTTLLILPATGKLSSAISSPSGGNVILVYPGLEQILSSGSWVNGVAILAHELGHIRLQHSGKGTDINRAQLEADRFAFQCGFGEELLQTLFEYDGNQLIQARIRHLNHCLAAKNQV
ncbi:MAG: hypothetical protein HN353_10855 [Bdellovibrionales bacterium]|jgi:hypothetical protein|nr:hypothetical protein [Bdellovibrionales bacterium]MBT3524794.1 hypothetical protein [Bdellovibrionales bacterium]MBT7668779.1 hypothetical protein [Bdellovibrionales bacterium]MBT7768062.1 hypothetical protein [Bdellovibrionales bacterium]